MIFLPLLFLALSCKHEVAQDSISQTKILADKNLNEVRVLKLEKTSFHKEIISNGKLTALQKSTLTFGVGEEIVEKNYKNGDFVEKGTVIASLNKEALCNKRKQVQLRYKKAILELQDILIGQGYELSDTTFMPDDLLETTKLLSGYSVAENELIATNLSICKTDLRVPFSGILTGIKHNVHDRIGASEIYCTLINNEAFLVCFEVLESEIEDIKPYKIIKAAPFSSNHFKYTGSIYEINPVVDENGLIQVKAILESTTGLMEGMNMKVRVRTMVPNKLIVPKSAVLIRQNKDVLFKYSGGKAIWTYIIKEFENSSSYAVKLQPNSIGSLEAGDTVIISGNLNLAHESEVQIRK